MPGKVSAELGQNAVLRARRAYIRSVTCWRSAASASECHGACPRGGPTPGPVDIGRLSMPHDLHAATPPWRC